MQIVIDIPDNCKTNKELFDYLGVMSKKLSETLANGTLLPKGHGALKDADKLKEEIYVIDVYSEESVKQQISDAPTIIEADTASEG